MKTIGLALLLTAMASVALAGPSSAPEIDANSGFAALGLLGGVLLVVRGHKK